MAQRRTGRRVQRAAQTAVDFRGGKAIRRGRLDREEFAQERFDPCGPERRVIAARSAGGPGVLAMVSGGPEITGLKFVEASAAQAERFCGGGGGDFVAPERGQDFAD